MEDILLHIHNQQTLFQLFGLLPLADPSWWHKEKDCAEYNGHLVLIVKIFSPFFFFKGDRAITPQSPLIGSIAWGLMVSLVLVRNVKVVPIISARKRMVICHCVRQWERLIQQNIQLRTWLTLSGETERDARWTVQQSSCPKWMLCFLCSAVSNWSLAA